MNRHANGRSDLKPARISSERYFRCSQAAKWPPLRAHLASKIFHAGLEAAASVRDTQRAERHLDRTEHAEHHRCVDVTHVGDPERAALQITDPAAEDDAALLATKVADHARLAALHEHRGHRVRALLGLD